MSDDRIRAWQEELVQTCSAHHGLLFRLAFGILRDAHAAEDACQQALVKACEQSQNAGEPTHLRAWLAKVVVNESLQVLRRRGIEQRARRQWADYERGLGGSGQEPGLRPAILEALGKLPGPNGLIVLLRIMDGRRGNDVAELLGLSAADVSRRLYASMEILRGLLAEYDRPEALDGSYGS